MRQLLPTPYDMHLPAREADGRCERNEDEMTWPCIARIDRLLKETCEIEPGESDELDFDFSSGDMRQPLPWERQT